MSKIKELLVASAIPAIKAAGKLEVENVLWNVKKINTEEIYLSTIREIHANFLLLKATAIKTKTFIDDGILDLVLEAVKECAGIDGIKLA